MDRQFKLMNSDCLEVVLQMHRFSKWGLKREPFVRLCCSSKKHTSLSCTRLLDTGFFIISLTMANCFMISKCFAIFCTSLQLRQTSQRANFSQFCGPSQEAQKVAHARSFIEFPVLRQFLSQFTVLWEQTPELRGRFCQIMPSGSCYMVSTVLFETHTE